MILKSTEIFDVQTWYQGPELPQAMYCGQLNTTIGHDKLLWVGGGDITGNENGVTYADVYQLSKNLDVWVKPPLYMKEGRIFFAEINAPHLC